MAAGGGGERAVLAARAADARRAETSLRRTYRYLRIGVVGTVALLAVSVLAAGAQVGLLPSISAYYYSPARDGFVGALVAVSLALLALSGRGPSRSLLDAAALFAPLIAFVPTQVPAGPLGDLLVNCGGAPACVPPAVWPSVDNGVTSYLVIGVLALVLTLLLGVPWGGRDPLIPLARIWPSVVAAAAVLLVVWLLWWLAFDVFLRWTHYVATIAFFALIAAVAVLEAFGMRTDVPGRPPRRFRIAYIAIAIAILADLVALTVIGLIGLSTTPAVFVCEFALLGLFAAFWTLQTVEKWHGRDPALRRAST